MSEMKKICSSSGQSDKDRISVLPDAIQTHILSFLPIEDAFRTSLLSSQWRHACSTLSKLQFIKSIYESKKKDRISDFKFYDFVDRVLHAHNESSIDELWLAFNVNDEPVATHQIDEWISIAVSHHVQTFYFRDNRSISSAGLYTVPSTLITCTTLKDLFLRNVHVNFPTTTTVCFPTLTRLKLLRCHLIDAVFSTSNCPVLEDLIIRECDFDMLSISSSTLHYLDIYAHIRHPKINLSVPNLIQIDYTAKDPPSISIGTLSSLHLARFRVRSNHPCNGDFACMILKGLHNVKDLTVTEFYVEGLAINAGRLLDYPATPCCSLEVLKLKYSSTSQVPVLKLVLRSYPKLQTLQLWYDDETTALPMDDSNAGGYGEAEKESPPSNTLNRLNKVEFLGFRGSESEFELMKYVVENAGKLQRMKILGPSQERIYEENGRIIVEKLKLYIKKRKKKLKKTAPFATFINGSQWMYQHNSITYIPKIPISR